MTATRLPAAVRDLLRNPTTDADLLGRFVSSRDEAAFAELVRRHGGPVWDVCRAVLRNAADADDAFQATFLTLARRASALRKPASVGAWLHGVAVRVARKARLAATRRQRHEAAYQPAPVGEAGECDVRAVVHEALAALPDVYREPLVACYLRGQTHADTAAELGLTAAAVKKRLERGRDRLRAALRRRGVAPVLVIAAAGPVPAPLLAAAARLVAAPAPPAVLTLAEGGVPMSLAKVTLALVLAAGVGFAVVAQERSEPTPIDPPAAKRLPPKKDVPPAARGELDGTWSVTGIETGGKLLFDARNHDATLPAPTFVIAGDTCRVKNVRVLYLTDFRLDTDATTSPKEIDATMLDGPMKGRTAAGIYQVHDGELRICLRLQRPELGRPKGYATNSGTTLYTFFLRPAAKAVVEPAPELRFDEVLQSGNKLYLVMNGTITKSFPDDLAPFAARLPLAVRTADRVKADDLTVVMFRRFDAKSNEGVFTGFTREQIGRYAAEVPAKRVDKLTEHAWTPGRLPKDAVPLPPDLPKADAPRPDVSARVVLPSDRVPPEPPGDSANTRVSRHGYLELLNLTGKSMRVTVTPSQVRVTIKAAGSVVPPITFDGNRGEEEPAKARTVELPTDAYVGLNAVAAPVIFLGGRPAGGDVHIGRDVWRLSQGRYRIEGTVVLTVGGRQLAYLLEPTSFTIP